MLESRFNHKYDYQRAKCEDLEVICAWFRHVLNKSTKNGIAIEDIFNFYTIGFQMGAISTAKVATAEEKAHADTMQPGNRE